MISINQKDERLPEISKEGNLNFDTAHNYRIYGLKQEGNPPILVEYTSDDIAIKKLQLIKGFFKTNKIKMEFAKLNEGKHDCYIGLRPDVRAEMKVAIAALRTIIYTLENRLELKKTQKVKTPAFK